MCIRDSFSHAAAPRASGRHGNLCETTTMVKPRATYVRSSGLGELERGCVSAQPHLDVIKVGAAGHGRRECEDATTVKAKRSPTKFGSLENGVASVIGYRDLCISGNASILDSTTRYCYAPGLRTCLLYT